MVDILRQVEELVPERGHRQQPSAPSTPRRSQKMVRHEYSPLTITGWCGGLFTIAAAILMHGEKRGVSASVQNTSVCLSYHL